MFKCVLARDKNELNYEFPNAVFTVESFNYDARRETIECKVIGFADEQALNSYKTKIANKQFHELEKSMVYNKYVSVKTADVASSQHEVVSPFVALDYMKDVIERVVVATDPIFKDAAFPE